jgi:hypothetical protein
MFTQYETRKVKKQNAAINYTIYGALGFIFGAVVMFGMFS